MDREEREFFQDLKLQIMELIKETTVTNKLLLRILDEASKRECKLWKIIKWLIGTLITLMGIISLFAGVNVLGI